MSGLLVHQEGEKVLVGLARSQIPGSGSVWKHLGGALVHKEWLKVLDKKLVTVARTVPYYFLFSLDLGDNNIM